MLRETGNVSRSARAIAVDRSTVYLWRDREPEFAAAWHHAEQEFLDELESEAHRRAKEGTIRPVFQGGEKVGEIREFSDTLAIFMLKGRRPEVYRDRTEVTGKDGGPIRFDLTKPVEDIPDQELNEFIDSLEKQLK